MSSRSNTVFLATVQQVVRLLASFGIICDEATAARLLEQIGARVITNNATGRSASSTQGSAGSSSSNASRGFSTGPPVDVRAHSLGLGGHSRSGGGVAVASSTAIPLPAVSVKPDLQALCKSMESQCTVRPPARKPKGKNKKRNVDERFFAIVRGTHAGVVWTWLRASQYVNHCSGAVFKGYDTEDEALERFWSEFPDNVRSQTGIVLGVPGLTQVPASSTVT